MKIIEGSKIVLHRVLQKWLSALYVVLQTCCIVCYDNFIKEFRYFYRMAFKYVLNSFSKMRKLGRCTHCLLNTESNKWHSSNRRFSNGSVYRGMGDIPVFSYVHRFRTFFGSKFLEKWIFWEYEEKVDSFEGSLQNWTIFWRVISILECLDGV